MTDADNSHAERKIAKRKVSARAELLRLGRLWACGKATRAQMARFRELERRST